MRPYVFPAMQVTYVALKLFNSYLLALAINRYFCKYIT